MKDIGAFNQQESDNEAEDDQYAKLGFVGEDGDVPVNPDE